MIYFPTSWGTKEPQNLPNHRVECTPSLPTCHSYCQYTTPKASGEVGPPPETCELLNVRILQEIERDEGQILDVPGFLLGEKLSSKFSHAE